MKVRIIDEIFEVEPEYYDVPIGELIQKALDRKKESALVEYLKNKYAGFVGIPTSCLEDELLIEPNQVQNFLSLYYGRKKVQFVDFGLVADVILNMREN
jgi:hypothetical protein